ncbi:MAG: serine protease [Planctomycetota bacterium]
MPTLPDLRLAALAAVAAAAATTCCSAQCGGGVCTPAARPSAPTTIAANPHASTCRVIVTTPTGVGLGSGSLVSVRGGRGYVVTCHHLFGAEAETAVVAFPSGGRYQARRFASDPAHDVTLLEIANPQRRPIAVADRAPSGQLTAGGFGGDGAYRAVRGSIAGYALPAGASAPSLRIRGSVRSGDSGGPVTNAKGELVGVVWGVRDGLSYAAFGDPIRRLLEKIPTARRSSEGAPPLVQVRPARPPALRDRPASAQDVASQLQQPVVVAPETPPVSQCDCRGNCVTRSELSDLASRADLDDLRIASAQQESNLLERLHDATSRRPSWPTMTTVQVIAGALGVGGPAGLALVALGALARRRRRRGRGGSRREPFRR